MCKLDAKLPGTFCKLAIYYDTFRSPLVYSARVLALDEIKSFNFDTMQPKGCLGSGLKWSSGFNVNHQHTMVTNENKLTGVVA